MINGPKHFSADFSEDVAAMAELESDLRRALRQEDAPVGFADRVLAAATLGKAAPALAAPPARSKFLHWPQRRLWLTAGVAAALVVGVIEGDVAYTRTRAQKRRVVEATRQFETTERITTQVLAQAREQLQRAGVPLNLD